MLLKTPGFTAVALLSLALGIGASAVIFSVAHAILLRPLPYKNPDRLISVSETFQSFQQRTSFPGFLDWKSQSQIFERWWRLRVDDSSSQARAGMRPWKAVGSLQDFLEL